MEFDDAKDISFDGSSYLSLQYPKNILIEFYSENIFEMESVEISVLTVLECWDFPC